MRLWHNACVTAAYRSGLSPAPHIPMPEVPKVITVDQAVFSAAERGDAGSVGWILWQISYVNHYIHTSGAFAAFWIAASNGHVSVIKMMAEGAGVQSCRYIAGADERYGPDHTSPLWAAVSRSKLEVVKELVSRGAQIWTACRNGRSAVQVAAENGDVEIVRALLGQKPSATVRFQDWDIVEAAEAWATSTRGQEETASMLRDWVWEHQRCYLCEARFVPDPNREEDVDDEGRTLVTLPTCDLCFRKRDWAPHVGPGDGTKLVDYLGPRNCMAFSGPDAACPLQLMDYGGHGWLRSGFAKWPPAEVDKTAHS
ncbi:hypothetical protein QBC44DRAFT_55748 [Cladorrhinum sp. PSN332]|nr:hypothetical protein QBC44DRAFT_55748 [Cladorrhinum sp. PSN332]